MRRKLGAEAIRNVRGLGWRVAAGMTDQGTSTAPGTALLAARQAAAVAGVAAPDRGRRDGLGLLRELRPHGPHLHGRPDAAAGRVVRGQRQHAGPAAARRRRASSSGAPSSCRSGVPTAARCSRARGPRWPCRCRPSPGFATCAPARSARRCLARLHRGAGHAAPGSRACRSLQSGSFRSHAVEAPRPVRGPADRCCCCRSRCDPVARGVGQLALAARRGARRGRAGRAQPRRSCRSRACRTRSRRWSPPSTACSPGCATPSPTQRRFVQDAAHELRTPMTAIGLQLENLRAHVPPRRCGRALRAARGRRARAPST